MPSPLVGRRAAIGLLSAAALLVTAAVPVAAAPSPAGPAPIRVDAQVGIECLEVRAPLKQTTVRVTQKRDGSTIRTASGRTSNQRRVVLCLSKLRSGDVLVIKQGTANRKLTVPTLTVTPRQDDTVTGRVPTSNLAFVLWVSFGMGGAPSSSYSYENLTADKDGTFSMIVINDGDINGSDSATVYWTSPKGDTWLAISPLTRAFLVEAGRAGATIVDKIGRTVTLSLWSGGGALRGTATATLTKATKKVTFRDDGDPVTVQIGDRVTTSSAPSLDMEVIDPQLVLDSGSVGGEISFRCLEDSAWQATITLDGEFVYRWGGTTGTGDVNFEDVIQPTDDPSGHDVVVLCESNDGFVQRFRGTFE